MKYLDWNTIRNPEENNIIARNKVLVGKYRFNSGSSVFGHPRVENGQSALENQVSGRLS